MPKTIIKVKTFMCPNGIGDKNSFCRFHRAWDNLPKDRWGYIKCPTCNLELEKSILDKDKMTRTVMGEEDIEVEILDRDEPKHRSERITEIDAQIERMDRDGEFATEIKKERIRESMKKSAEEHIVNLKKQKGSDPSEPTFSPLGYFLKNAAEVTTYRVKRKKDIAKAIVEARKHEDK